MTAMLSGAPCLDVDPETFFPPAGKANARAAKRICADCPVRLQCLRDALEAEGNADTRNRYGVFGGLTAWERTQLNRKMRARR